MYENRIFARDVKHEVAGLFPDRWSPRAFEPRTLCQDQIEALFEAARWTPSCFNEQPWRFVYGAIGENEVMLNALAPKNVLWVKNASLLIFCLAKPDFKLTGENNGWAEFDLGAACMSIALQARHLGLFAHAMAGFDEDAALKALELDPGYWRMKTAMAVGYRASSKTLDPSLQGTELASGRKDSTEIAARFGQKHKDIFKP